MARSVPSLIHAFVCLAIVATLARGDHKVESTPGKSGTGEAKPAAASRGLRRLPEGQTRSVFLKAAGADKDTVLRGEEYPAAIEALAKLAELPEGVKTSTAKIADRNNDGAVDWFEFNALVRQTPTVAEGADEQPQETGADAEDGARIIKENQARNLERSEKVQAILQNQDSNGDGMISGDEAIAAGKKVMEVNRQYGLTEGRMTIIESGPGYEKRTVLEEPGVTAERLATLRATVLKRFDGDGNGSLDDDELATLRAERNRGFQKGFDHDHDGELNEEELREWENSSQHRLLQALEESDENRDGLLDNKEAQLFHKRLNRDKQPTTQKQE